MKLPKETEIHLREHNNLQRTAPKRFFYEFDAKALVAEVKALRRIVKRKLK